MRDNERFVRENEGVVRTPEGAGLSVRRPASDEERLEGLADTNSRLADKIKDKVAESASGDEMLGPFAEAYSILWAMSRSAGIAWGDVQDMAGIADRERGRYQEGVFVSPEADNN